MSESTITRLNGEKIFILVNHFNYQSPKIGKNEKNTQEILEKLIEIEVNSAIFFKLSFDLVSIVYKRNKISKKRKKTTM
jgi:hypothetical protein